MKFNTLALIAIALVFGASIAGCKNTAEGMQEDASRNMENMEKGAKEASEKAGEMGRDLEAAAKLTPTIKSAIMADPSLNDPGNSINVESSEETVKLIGHVKTAEMKKIAISIAERAIKEANGKQTVTDELTVQM